MHGSHRRRKVAGVSGPLKVDRVGLTALVLLAVLALTALPAIRASAATVPPRTWVKPPTVEGMVFPVLRSAEWRWLNWRDTFGAPRMRLQSDGVWRQVGIHEGIDIFTEEHAPVASMTAGRIERVGWTFYSGWRVGVRGTDGKYYFYAHLSTFAPGLAEGQSVGSGQILGRVGNSGYGPEGTADEFPPHLHVGIQDGTRWVSAEPTLRKLYTAYVESDRAATAEAFSLQMRARALRARVYGPGSPPIDALTSTISQLEGRAATTRASRLMEL